MSSVTMFAHVGNVDPPKTKVSIEQIYETPALPVQPMTLYRYEVQTVHTTVTLVAKNENRFGVHVAKRTERTKEKICMKDYNYRRPPAWRC